VYFTDPVRVCIKREGSLWMVVPGDVPLRKQALKDSEWGSRADMTSGIWDAAMAGDKNRREAALEFGTSLRARGRRWDGQPDGNFLPMLPACAAKSDRVRRTRSIWEAIRGAPRGIYLDR